MRRVCVLTGVHRGEDLSGLPGEPSCLPVAGQRLLTPPNPLQGVTEDAHGPGEVLRCTAGLSAARAR